MDFGGQPLLKMNNGLLIPQIGFGVLGMKELEETEKVCLEAIKIGFRSFDTAHLYDNERGVGTALQKCGLPREDIFITTKLAPTDQLGEKVTEEAIDAMLRRLNTNYIDLLLIHHPFNDYCGAWKAMEKSVKDGKVKSIGLSNFEGKHWNEIMNICTIKPAVLQLEGHPYWNQHELKKRNELTGTLMQAWFPIGHGDKKLFAEPIIVELGKKYNKTPAQIILRWHIQEGNIPLPKASNPEHMKENFNIFDFKLNDEEMEKINQLPQKRYFDVPGSQVEGSKWVGIFNNFKAKHD